jgi:hypothetical protein
MVAVCARDRETDAASAAMADVVMTARRDGWREAHDASIPGPHLNPQPIGWHGAGWARAFGVGSFGMKAWQYTALICACLISGGAARETPLPIAIFPFGFDDTSLQGEIQGRRPDEQARLAAIGGELRDMVLKSGCCTAVPVADPPAGNVGACGGCEVDAARKAGARIAVIGWVQKVSNLILNINVVARDVATGKVISAGSVDIRGNTDESWSRGLSYLVRNRLHPSDWQVDR